MKKMIYIIISSLIIAFILFVSGSAIGGFEELKSVYGDSGFNTLMPFRELIDTVEEFSEINNLKIDTEARKVEIIDYDGPTVRVETKNVSSKIRITQEQDTLVVKDEFKLLDFSNDAKIKIFVPANKEFNKVEINIDAGKFTVFDLKAKQIEIGVDAGKFEAKSLVAAFTKVDVDAGEAKIDLLDCANSEFECDAGSITAKMTGSEADYSYETDCDVGTIKIGNYHCEEISDKYYHQGGLRQIKADCDVGDIIVKMEYH